MAITRLSPFGTPISEYPTGGKLGVLNPLSLVNFNLEIDKIKNKILNISRNKNTNLSITILGKKTLNITQLQKFNLGV